MGPMEEREASSCRTCGIKDSFLAVAVSVSALVPLRCHAGVRANLHARSPAASAHAAGGRRGE